MSYDKVNWDEATPITASRLDQMDDGIKEHVDAEENVHGVGHSGFASQNFVRFTVDEKIRAGFYTGDGTDEQDLGLLTEPIFMLVVSTGIQGFFWGEDANWAGYYFDDDQTSPSDSGINTDGQFIAKSSDGFNTSNIPYFYFGVS